MCVYNFKGARSFNVCRLDELVTTLWESHTVFQDFMESELLRMTECFVFSASDVKAFDNRMFN